MAAFKDEGYEEGRTDEKVSLAINLIRMGMGTLEKIAELLVFHFPKFRNSLNRIPCD